MKLYTQEQVRKAIELARYTHPEGRGYTQTEQYDYSEDEVFDLLTPIQVPSLEVIMQEIQFDEFDPEDIIYLAGINWMREILGGNK
jgi:hypothetical protein